MRIEGTQGAGPNGLNEGAAGPGKHAKAPASASAKPAEALQFDSVHATYVRKAAACETVNPAAVAEARKLLESGQLDTPEAAQRAAEAMISRGL